ncbi:MAG TPA: hypothetical protein VHA75_20045 [Rugosimonospora sp.]|nr:hypothetical protein [Rugosimonospora sp.]
MTNVKIGIGGKKRTVDLDALSPKARALAEAIADRPGREAGDIWMESDAPLSELVRDWQYWYTPEEGAAPERRPWRGWSTLPLRPGETPEERLEVEAAKIPPGWHVYGAGARRPVPSLEAAKAVREATADQVVAYLAGLGRRIGRQTWTSYVGKDEAPRPARKVGRTSLWDLDEVDKWLARPTARWSPTK